jgi:hypothetical protein
MLEWFLIVGETERLDHGSTFALKRYVFTDVDEENSGHVFNLATIQWRTEETWGHEVYPEFRPFLEQV